MWIIVAADLLAFLVVVVALSDGIVNVGLVVADGAAGIGARCPVVERRSGHCGGREGEEGKQSSGLVYISFI